MEFGQLNKVVILIKEGCPHCNATKQVMSRMALSGYLDLSEITYVDVSKGNATNRARFTDNFATVPQIFINGRHIIGGNSGLQAKYASGELMRIIN